MACSVCLWMVTHTKLWLWLLTQKEYALYFLTVVHKCNYYSLHGVTHTITFETLFKTCSALSCYYILGLEKSVSYFVCSSVGKLVPLIRRVFSVRGRPGEKIRLRKIEEKQAKDICVKWQRTITQAQARETETKSSLVLCSLLQRGAASRIWKGSFSLDERHSLCCACVTSRFHTN